MNGKNEEPLIDCFFGSYKYCCEQNYKKNISVSVQSSVYNVAKHLVYFSFAFTCSELRYHVFLVLNRPFLQCSSSLNLRNHLCLSFHHDSILYLNFSSFRVVKNDKIVSRGLFEFLLLHFQFNKVAFNFLFPLMRFDGGTSFFPFNLVELNQNRLGGLGDFFSFKIVVCAHFIKLAKDLVDKYWEGD